MSDKVRSYLKQYCEQQDITPRTLERMAGTGLDSIYEFLVGRRNDIKLNTAVKIADSLSISLDELADRQEFLKNFVPTAQYNKKINQVMFKHSVLYILDFLEKNTNKYSFKEIVHAINEIYDYMIDNDLKAFDKTFAHWICKNLQPINS